MNSLPKVGWIGTGIMGFNMCKFLLAKGYDLSVFNRTPIKAQGLLEIGAKWHTPQQIAATSDVLFLMLGYPKDVESMCIGKEGIVQHMKKGSVLVDHTTSTPSLAVQIYQQAKVRGIQSVDAPVSGGQIGAKEGKLVIMCGGQQSTINKVQPIMKNYSRSIQRGGDAGKGQHTKMANQITVAGNLAGTIEGLMYASKMGLDIQKTIQILSLGSANSATLQSSGRKIAKHDLNPGFYVQHFVKDMEIALDESSRVNLSLPCLALIKQLYKALQAQGGSRLGVQAMIKVLENMNNHKFE